MSNMGSSTSYRRAPGETTEWEDILVAKGIVAPKADPEEAKRQAALEEAIERKMDAFDPLAEKSARELDELEEEDGEFADSRVLERYRQARLQELKAAAAANRFGALFPLSRPDFVKEVTEASRAAPVVVLLYKDALAESRLLEAVMLRLAARHKATKFMKIVAESCIEGYPDRNVPTLFYYAGGEVRGSIVGLATLGGLKVSDKSVEWALSRLGAVQTELEEDPLAAGSAGAGGGSGGRTSGRAISSSGGRHCDSDEDG